MSWRRRDDSPREAPVEDSRLVKECAAFLSGSLAEERLQSGGVVRDWEWTSLLAHGSQRQLERFAQQPLSEGSDKRYDERWHDAIAFLAKELLGSAREAGTTLQTLQRSVVVPVELELATHDWMIVGGPAVLVRRVLDRLQQRPWLELSGDTASGRRAHDPREQG